MGDETDADWDDGSDADMNNLLQNERAYRQAIKALSNDNYRLRAQLKRVRRVVERFDWKSSSYDDIKDAAATDPKDES